MFRDRVDAGDRLGDLLADELGDVPDGMVLGLPRGGVPVAARVAARLGLPLDVFVVRKIGVPWHPELAMGAIAPGGVMVVNDEIVSSLRIQPSAFDEVVAREAEELERRLAEYRGDRDPIDLGGRTVILVDDGIATGATLRAAVEAARQSGASAVIVGVPVSSRQASQEFSAITDGFFAVAIPDPFDAVGMWYRDFRQTSDGEVTACLERQG